MPRISLGRRFRAAQIIERPLCCADKRLANLRILFLTDIHLSSMFPEAALDRLFEQVRPLNADLLLLGGDYAENEKGEFRFFELLGTALHPPLGAYAVLGNNDLEHFRNQIAPLRAAMTGAGVTLLQNQTGRINSSGARIVLAGLDDPMYGSPNATGMFCDAQKSDLCLLLCHSAQHLTADLPHCAQKPDLALTGHTHGGQICLFGKTLFDLGYEHRLKKPPIVSGETLVEGVPVIVSNGIGTSRISIRVNAPPQIHLLTLL